MFESPRHIADGIGGDAAAAGLKSSFPIGVSALSVAGVSLDAWVVILTVVYLLLQIVLLLPKALRMVRGKRENG